MRAEKKIVVKGKSKSLLMKYMMKKGAAKGKSLLIKYMMKKGAFTL